MRPITATVHLTLDGVAQGLARADEDTRDGFRHGGWGVAFHDDVAAREMAADMARPGDLLLGRRTWQDFSRVWGMATDGNPYSARMNGTTKYVVSRTLDSVAGWANSVLLRGDAVDTVRELKAESGRPLGIVGSISLVRALHNAGLIDHFTLLLTPLTLGSGTRLFDGPAPLTHFELTGCTPTSTGVIIARYARR